MRTLSSAFIILILLTLVTGGIYPLLTTLIAGQLFPFQAQGSRLMAEDRYIGSLLIGQSFTRDDYFHGRPSATAGSAYNTEASGGSNLAGSNPELGIQVDDRIAFWRRSNGAAPVPLDLVAASGSGLDPDISPESARYQAAAIAGKRGLSEQQVLALIDKQLAQRRGMPSFIAPPAINVLQLNLALDALAQR
ncbi:potassium-transporting ATPase subunit KdpC [Biostraticola tofi]|uniref:Potassium-transporting ATPase KdpC subunit n=1 Tax=Biostraticola tofi TaxID=466109 RepID=A0A4R3YZC8_9GAMM|nr:potassium-transporting ATPase subunit KdpC [Biostraticola tofi]TCV97996.1 K+-transporting ATPase ATPase C chain [Biostraticola tofi]